MCFESFALHKAIAERLSRGVVFLAIEYIVLQKTIDGCSNDRGILLQAAVRHLRKLLLFA